MTQVEPRAVRPDIEVIHETRLFPLFFILPGLLVIGLAGATTRRSNASPSPRRAS